MRLYVNYFGNNIFYNPKLSDAPMSPPRASDLQAKGLRIGAVILSQVLQKNDNFK
jgi:hypothetical protein